jgi:hypothetical protein
MQSVNFLLFSIILVCSSLEDTFGQPDSMNSGSPFVMEMINDTCDPIIKIIWGGESQSICLNHFTPQNDSCAALDLQFNRYGTTVSFNCNSDRLWTFTGIQNIEKSSGNGAVKISVNNNPDSSLSGAKIEITPDNDSSSLTLNLMKVSDLPNTPDTSKPLDYTLNIATFFCREYPKATVITDRVFEYPGYYMKKEPILNYPELSAFHYGGSIKMPTSESVNLRGLYIVVYHDDHPPAVKYDEPELIRKRLIWLNKMVNKHKKNKPVRPERKKFLGIKPL